MASDINIMHLTLAAVRTIDDPINSCMNTPELLSFLQVKMVLAQNESLKCDFVSCREKNVVTPTQTTEKEEKPRMEKVTKRNRQTDRQRLDNIYVCGTQKGRKIGSKCRLTADDAIERHIHGVVTMLRVLTIHRFTFDHMFLLIGNNLCDTQVNDSQHRKESRNERMRENAS